MLSASWRAVIATVLVVAGAASTQARADELADRISAPRKGSSSLVSPDASSLRVVIDFAKLLSFDQPARTIILGNPAVVDGTLNDEYTLILTGKSVGTTNMIVLDGEGREILNTTVSVVGNARQLTTVHQGAVQQVYFCDGSCRPLSAPAAPTTSK
ncbi:pilus assembly protein N-terminal domain-containing protein [Microvirga sp. VF16]|uniref:pilus assembly protein N-terminal domain-containing protein n=1 Tax=Microvirga sp. VF16 TaxID=2807101 RepID=UPI00193D9D69|nr:pilus assembly protein N-terminal domain-containing protein [Microvirga sp. VF16]QRM27648.1 pilus assembly protein N-terminal domain-containing protein [Microvirga sp. VF16]